MVTEPISLPPSDGSSFDGQVNYGPPPVAPVWQKQCKIDKIDPVTYVRVTEHVVYGTQPPIAGKVPVQSDDHLVFPYESNPPHLVPVNVEELVAGHQGFRANTWNIGTGVTAWVPFDCREPEPTTTTTQAPTTTTSTSLPASSITIGSSAAGKPVALVASGTPPERLPETGASPGDLIGGGFVCLTLGVIALRWAKGRWSGLSHSRG